MMPTFLRRCGVPVPRLASFLALFFAVIWLAAGLPAQTQKAGGGKVLGLPAPARDKRARAGRLTLPSRPREFRPKTRPVQTGKPSKGALSAVPDGEGAMVDFVDSLISQKPLEDSALVAEYSLLSARERRALLQRVHRLPSLAIGRLARVYRALNEPDGAAALLTALYSRNLGRETRSVVQAVLFLKGAGAGLVGLELLGAKHKAVRDATVPVLAKLLTRSDLPRLRMVLDGDRQGARLAALRVLSQWLRENDSESLTPLVRCLKHRDGSLRAQAAQSLRRFGSRIDAPLAHVLEKQDESSAYFLSALLLAERELLSGTTQLPPTCIVRLARHRFGVRLFERSVAFLVASMRFFRSPEEFRKTSGRLAEVNVGELMTELLSIANVSTYYPEFPICHEMALLSLRLLSGEDFGADHRRWSAWWSSAAKGFQPYRLNVELTPDKVASARIEYMESGERRFALLGRDAPGGEQGIVARLDAARMLDLWKQLREQGFCNLQERLAESKGRSEADSIAVVTAEARALDAFTGARSPRLRVLLNVMNRVLEREAWQEFVPQSLDAEARRNWWIGQSRAMREMKTQRERDQHVLGLALEAFPSLNDASRRRAIGLLLQASATKPSPIQADHVRRLLGLVANRSVSVSQKQSLFDVLATVSTCPFDEILTALDAQKDLPRAEVLRRMIAIGGPERVLVALRHKSRNIRAAAATEAAQVGNAATIRALITLLDDADWDVRRRACESCGKLRVTEAHAKIAALLGDPTPHVRQAALTAIARIGEKGAYELLVRALGPGEPGDRLAAVRGLTLLRDPRAGFALVQIAGGHFGSPLGLLALQGLRSRGGAALRGRVSALLQASDNPKLRREFVFLLGEMGDISVFKELLRLVATGDSAVRSCRLLAGIVGVDWCGRRDRVKLYREWYAINAGASVQRRFIAAIAAAGIDSGLTEGMLVPSARSEVVDKVADVVVQTPDPHWALRVLGANVLRVLTGQDFGAVRRSSDVGGRMVIAERYREFARLRDADRRR